MTKRLQGKIALITGASRGIGAAVAKRFAYEGAQTILVARTIGGLEAVDDAIQAENGKRAVIVPLDLRQGDKIDELGAIIHERFGKLDILVGNAGVLGTLSPLHHIKPKTWDEVMAVNVTANFRLIRSFDPLLRLSDQGRAIFVSSGAASSEEAYWGPYATSKAALETMVKIYASELGETSVKANLIDPGMVRTAMLSKALPGINPDLSPKPDTITDIFVSLASGEIDANGECFTPSEAA